MNYARRSGRRGERERDRLTARLACSEAVLREQSELQHVAELVAAARPTREICDAAATAAANLFEAAAGLVACLKLDHGVVKGGCLRIALSDIADYGDSFTFDPCSAIGQMTTTGHTCRVAEGTASKYRHALGERIAAPITLGDGLWGTLVVAGAPGQRFAGGAEQRLERFANLLALAIGNAEARDQLLEQAATDALTGLANRHVYTDRLEQEIARSERNDLPLSLVLFDVDHFKAVNDEHGHLTGDAVLLGVAQTLTYVMRTEITCARIGGDEFAAIVPNASRDQAEQMAQRALERVRARAFDGVPVTLSIGVCELGHAMTCEQLQSGTDQALYAAKHAGRDTIQCYTASPGGRGDGDGTED
jgi:diguanylate cyclase (GGDEF)-like protein